MFAHSESFEFSHVSYLCCQLYSWPQQVDTNALRYQEVVRGTNGLLCTVHVSSVRLSVLSWGFSSEQIDSPPLRTLPLSSPGCDSIISLGDSTSYEKETLLTPCQESPEQPCDNYACSTLLSNFGCFFSFHPKNLDSQVNNTTFSAFEGLLNFNEHRFFSSETHL